VNKNLIYMVAIDHEKSQHNHSMFSTYSTKRWEYWCKKNNTDLHIVRQHKDKYGFPIWNKLDVCEVGKSYDKIGIVDCDTMIHWDSKNPFDFVEKGIYGVRDISNLNWVYQSAKNYGDEFFDFELDFKKYVNAGVIFLDNNSLDVYSKLKDFYLSNKTKLDNWDKGGGKEQTLFNYITQQNDYDVNLISPIWNTISMHKTEFFHFNWQSLGFVEPPYRNFVDLFNLCKNNNVNPFFIDYGNVWHFTGFPIEWREEVMRLTWELVGKNYE